MRSARTARQTCSTTGNANTILMCPWKVPAQGVLGSYVATLRRTCIEIQDVEVENEGERIACPIFFVRLVQTRFGNGHLESPLRVISNICTPDRCVLTFWFTGIEKPSAQPSASLCTSTYLVVYCQIHITPDQCPANWTSQFPDGVVLRPRDCCLIPPTR